MFICTLYEPVWIAAGGGMREAGGGVPSAPRAGHAGNRPAAHRHRGYAETSGGDHPRMYTETIPEVNLSLYSKARAVLTDCFRLAHSYQHSH